MLVESLTVIVGVAIILGLAEIIVRNSIEIAKHYGISGTFIGLTVLSIGTSIPEIMTHIIGSIQIVQSPELMTTLSALLIGTNIGSDIFQQNFILPLIGIIGTIIVVRKNLFTHVGSLIGAALLLWVFSLGGFISRLESFMLLLAYAGYLVYLRRQEIKEQYNAKNHLTKKRIWLAFSLIGLSFVVMAVVSDLVLNSSRVLIETLPISASFFGIILLGVATALPELTTSLIAVFKKKEEISAGILIGSNITNPLVGVGLGGIISEYVVPSVVVLYDLPIKIFTASLIYLFLRDKKLLKWEAIILISLFIAYLFLRQIYFPMDV